MTETPVPEGPGWVAHGLLDVRGGLSPSRLSHFIATIGKLLPGATTVTTLPATTASTPSLPAAK